VPLSALSLQDLERIATALELRAGSAFVDLACGLGGPGLWVAERCGAHFTGVDISAVAGREAQALASRRGFEGRAQIVTADACATPLPDHAFDGVMSIDAIQFMDAAKASAEIARLLRPAGRAAILTWEALVEVEVPTVVTDYGPFLEASGLRVCLQETIADARERELQQFHALVERAEDLRAEIGEAAEPILYEARQRIASEHEPPRVRKVFIVAQA
jgi:ubiquinone/menaquinone biosynthesis C-methylase UbiE